jgi:hypothetical protein
MYHRFFLSPKYWGIPWKPKTFFDWQKFLKKNADNNINLKETLEVLDERLSILDDSKLLIIVMYVF